MNPELLSGVGNFSCAIAAIKNGADAVYFGIKEYNMRDLGTNFKESEMPKLMNYLHQNNAKGYLALNTIVFDKELKRVNKILDTAKKSNVDAVILSDLGVLALAKKHNLNCFLSTQASVSNYLAVKEFAKLGVKRIILARELDLNQIKKITRFAHKIGVEIEVFVHGAMCIAVSGRCFLSHEIFGKSANRGKCLQPCRRAFFLDGSAPNFEKKELYLEGGTILSPKDLKTISFLDKIIASGVDSLKIEGRTKPADYVAITTKCYREAIDSVKNKTFSKSKIDYWNAELEKVYNRGFSDGFFFSTPNGKDLASGQGSFQKQKRIQIGFVVNYYPKVGVAEIKVIDNIKLNDELIFEGKTTFLKQRLDSMESHHKKINFAKKGDLIGVKVNERVRINDLVFKLVERNLDRKNEDVS